MFSVHHQPDATQSLFGRGPTGSEGQQDRGAVTGPMMAQYLLAMIAERPGHADSLNELLGAMLGPGGPGGAGSGRWGDYVLNQEGTWDAFCHWF